MNGSILEYVDVALETTTTVRPARPFPPPGKHVYDGSTDPPYIYPGKMTVDIVVPL